MFEREFSAEELKEVSLDFWWIDKYTDELERCYAEIERQRALIERAIPMVQHYPYDVMKTSQWLKDASGEVLNGTT